jgi:hypothetical protein
MSIFKFRAHEVHKGLNSPITVTVFVAPDENRTFQHAGQFILHDTEWSELIASIHGLPDLVRMDEHGNESIIFHAPKDPRS